MTTSIVVKYIAFIISIQDKNQLTRLFCLFICWDCQCCLLRRILVRQWNVYYYRIINSSVVYTIESIDRLQMFTFQLSFTCFLTSNVFVKRATYKKWEPNTSPSGRILCELEICHWLHNLNKLGLLQTTSIFHLYSKLCEMSITFTKTDMCLALKFWCGKGSHRHHWKRLWHRLNLFYVLQNFLIFVSKW